MTNKVIVIIAEKASTGYTNGKLPVALRLAILEPLPYRPFW
ncbi:hypothetical protein [Mycolicibacterium sp.]|nr:hypothetical protein [Mycolicibacterium sp.]